MIESISIADIATFKSTPEVLDGLSEFNYFYGANGSGKTTISRVIANPADFPACQVNWKSGNTLQSMVYNYDFIERNFTQTKELKGVFTLGEAQAEILEQIATLKKEIDKLVSNNSILQETLDGIDGKGGKKNELMTVETEFKNRIWELKKKYDSDFTASFEGLRNNAERFRDRFIQEYTSNKASLLSLDDLKKKAQSIFESNPTLESIVPVPNGARLIGFESSKILSKPVIGKNDVNIAAMIQKLGNSDWVRTGKAYFEVNDSVCPFCQQPTPHDFAKCLGEYFDEAFLHDIRELNELYLDYETECASLNVILQSIQAASSRFLETEKFSSTLDLFVSRCTVNVQKLKDKKNEPSRIIQLEPLHGVLDSILSMIEAANKKISEHNTMVTNLGSEKKVLINQVWRFLLEEAKEDMSSYSARKGSLIKAINGIESQMQKNSKEKETKEKSVRNLEKQTTSIQPTIDGINALLRQFGFTSFILGRSSTGTSYQLLRPNGTEAKATLSEGEKTFVCFLYFYHLLKGSDSESGISRDRIVVFDDPVSSLDSDILFIVSSLIKGLFEEVRNNAGYIKQVFILTHNVYFHKEITFNIKRRNNQTMSEETFWTVQKTDQGTKVTKWQDNPIKTSYDLLWAEVRNTNKSSSTIQNTLRKILENYFKILGGIDTDKICDMFSGRDKLVCKSLFSWVNDGSHFAQDDLYISIDSSQIDTYLTVFKQIFEKSDHLAHYNMMMGESFCKETASAVLDSTD